MRDGFFAHNDRTRESWERIFGTPPKPVTTVPTTIYLKHVDAPKPKA